MRCTGAAHVPGPLIKVLSEAFENGTTAGRAGTRPWVVAVRNDPMNARGHRL
jgi:hypothetical protein